MGLCGGQTARACCHARWDCRSSVYHVHAPWLTILSREKAKYAGEKGRLGLGIPVVFCRQAQVDDSSHWENLNFRSCETRKQKRKGVSSLFRRRMCLRLRQRWRYGVRRTRKYVQAPDGGVTPEILQKDRLQSEV